MSHGIASQTFTTTFVPRHGLQRLAAEIGEFVAAMLHPGKVIAEVHAMRDMQIEAARIEASQPVRAQLLRRQASRIGLR